MATGNTSVEAELSRLRALLEATQGQLEREQSKTSKLTRILREHDIAFNEGQEEDSGIDVSQSATTNYGRRGSNVFQRFQHPGLLAEEGRLDAAFAALAAAIGEGGRRPVSSVRVRLQDVSMTITKRKEMRGFPTVGQVLCTPLTAPFKKAEMCTTIALQDVTTIFEPGKMYLVLGPPQSGKSTLLKAVAGLLPRSCGSVSVKGSVTYNGEAKDSGSFVMSSLATYVEQLDQNEPHLTVAETLQFSGAALGAIPREMSDSKLTKHIIESLEAEKPGVSKLPKHKLEEEQLGFKNRMIQKLLGLSRAADTLVGNETVRGISGGERRRTTLGEMLMGVRAIRCFDEISTGLDSAATYDIMATIRAMTRAFQATSLVTLLQPPPEVFRLFDQVVLLKEGRIIFQGPVDNALEHLASVGYRCPEQMDAADFLVSVASTDSWRYRDPVDEEGGRAGQVVAHPKTAADFAARLRDTKEWADIQAAIDAAEGPAQWTPLECREYANSWGASFLLLFHRELLFLRRNMTGVKARIMQNLVMGLVTGTIFWQISPDSVNSRFGSLFQAMMSVGMASASQLPTYFEHRTVFYKHRAARFYQPSAYCLATTIATFPLLLIDSLGFGTIFYFCSGMSMSSGGAHYGIFLIILLTLGTTVTQLMRLLSFITPNAVAAMGLMGLIMLFLLIFSGFIVPRSQVPDYYVWVVYLNPFYYCYQALAANEFLSDRYKQSLPGGLTKGEAALEQKGLEKDAYWVWAGLLVSFGIFLLYFAASSLAAHYLTQSGGASSTSSPEEEEEEEGGAAGGAADASKSAEAGTVNAAAPGRMAADGKVGVHPPGEHSLPFEPTTLAFKDVWYSVTIKNRETADLLKGVTGWAKPGSVTALMGSSGAGKTTLLDVLAGRKTSGKITGTITINGYPLDPETFRRVTGYVEQQDIHSPFTTVLEALQFSAVLRLPSSVTAKDRRAFVKDTLSLLELTSISDEVVGPKGSGLSTEQRKRLTIGVELVANPSLLFLDEPTSGLDARAAVLVMRVVKRLAMGGRTIVCTIHQPSLAIFQQFDALLLLKRGGQTVYFGPLGLNSSSLIRYLEAIPSTPPISDSGENPATWMLTCIGAGTVGFERADYAAEYLKSDLFRSNEAEIVPLLTPLPGVQPLPRPTPPSLLDPYVACCLRMFRSYWRQPSYNLVRSCLCILLALIVASVYTNVKQDTIAGLVGILAIIFMGLLFTTMINANTVQGVVHMERSSFYREQFTRMYTVDPYALGWFLAEIPYVLFLTSAFSWIFYFCLKLNGDWWRFLTFWAYVTMFVSFGTGFGQAVGAATPSTEVAQVVVQTLVPLFSTFSGFSLKPSDIPVFWKWLYYINPLKYALEGIVVSQWHGTDRVVRIYNPQAKATITINAWTFLDAFFGHEFLWSRRFINLGILAGFILATRIIFTSCLRFVKYETR